MNRSSSVNVKEKSYQKLCIHFKRFFTIQSFIIIRRIIFLKSYVTLFLKRHCIGMVHFLDMYFMYLCKLIICHFIALFFCFRCGCQMQKTLIEAFLSFIQPVQVFLWNTSSRISNFRGMINEMPILDIQQWIP